MKLPHERLCMNNFVIGMFIFSVIALVISVVLYSKSSETAYNKTLEQINLVVEKVNTQERLVLENIKSIGNNKAYIDQRLKEERELTLLNVQRACEEIDYKQMDLKDDCNSLKLKYIDILEKISKKKTEIKMPQSITIEVVNEKKSVKGKGLESLFKSKK